MEGTARPPRSPDAPLTHSAWAHFRGAELGVPIACAAFVASVQTHGRYFLMQQKSERDFVRWLPTLCDGVSSAAVEDREARYYSALNDRLRQLRASINRHVHAAFMVKAMCASVHEGRDVSRAINWTAARANKDSGSRAGEYASYAPLSFCNLPILDHEPATASPRCVSCWRANRCSLRCSSRPCRDARFRILPAVVSKSGS